MAERRPIAWVPFLIGATVMGAALLGVFWQWSLQALDGQIHEKHTALKRLSMSGGVPPNQEVMDYLVSRQVSLEEQYRHWVEAVVVPPVAEAAADPQLYFQEQLHQVQRTLERLATARAITVPEQLGFPKELPPSDTVPRLLIQLSLIQETASLILEQGVNTLTSFKVEDPEALPEEQQGEGVFLTRVPVRVRLTCSLPKLMKVVGAIERARPLIDVRAIRIAPAVPSVSAPASNVSSSSSTPTNIPTASTSSAAPKVPAPPAPVQKSSTPQEGAGTIQDNMVDVELLLSRYLAAAPLQEPMAAEVTEPSLTKKTASRAGSRTPHQTGKESSRSSDE